MCKITSLYVAKYNTDFAIGLLLLIDGTSDKVCVWDYRSYFEWMMETAVCGAAGGDSRRYCLPLTFSPLFDAQC